MLETIVKNNVIFYVMGIVTGVGVFGTIISYLTVRRMVKAASEIGKSNHRLMKLVKAKFEHASMISEKMQNVEAFVNKYIHEYKVFGVSLHTWSNMWMETILILGVCGVLGAVGTYQLHHMNEMLFQYVAWTGVAILLLFLFHVYADKKYRIEVTRNYMVEYLENVCMHRYAKAAQQVVEEENDLMKSELPDEPVQKNVETIKIETECEEIREQKEESTQEQMLQDERIREILQEFLA